MKDHVVVSVVMSAFNEETLIAKAIKSIIDQSYVNWELIIVDDGSTDLTKKIINTFVSKDKRIILIENMVNLGLAKSLNIGIARAKGKYIARMDADDESFHNRLKCQTVFLDLNSDIDVLGTGAILIDGQGNYLEEFIQPEMHENIVKHIFKTSPFFHSTIMMRKEFIDRMGGYNELSKRAEDHDLWLRSRSVGKFHNLPEIHLRYLVCPKVIIRSFYDGAIVRLKYSVTFKEYVKAIFWSFIDLLVMLRQRVRIEK